MKIIGIGVDIVENNRIKTSIKKKIFRKPNFWKTGNNYFKKNN